MLHQSPYQYSLYLRVMHWIVAITIISLLISGVVMVKLDDIVSYKYDIYAMHKSFGSIALIMFILRLIARLKSHIPPKIERISNLESILAKITHILLYVFMLLVPLSGFMMSMLGKGVAVFGYKIPQIFGINKALAKDLHQIHVVIPYILIALISLHIAATIKHHYWDKYDILNRIKINFYR